MATATRTLGRLTPILFATVLTLGSSVLAFGSYSPLQTKEKPDPLFIASARSFSKSITFGRPTIALCEAKSGADQKKDIKSNGIFEQLESSEIYTRINPPLRMMEDSHAVGQMLRPNMIEKYDIYKKMNAASTSFKEPNATANIVTALIQFGNSLDGHPGVVHGGILALVLDDVFGFSYEAIGVPMAVTANLNLDYRAPVPADSNILIQVHLNRRENRKLYFTAEITSPDGSVVYTEATCLYIIPRSVWETMNKQS